jgi:pimeloyl-ACP methyl ester carboxylesterase
MRYDIEAPSLLAGRTVNVTGRGEFFVRHSQHADMSAPTVLLLHGWTASCDLNFFTAYDELAAHASVIGIDHRGHGRGLRPDANFTLEDCADDAAAVCRALGVSSVVAVGYSMGGPIAMLLTRRHPELVSGLVLQATALEWRATMAERARFKVSRVLGPITRRFIRPSTIRFVFARRITRRHPLRRHLGWMMSEWRRNDPWHMAQAGRAISMFDARPFASSLRVPVSVVLTTKDQLVLPRKQRELAEAMNAQVVPLDGDHFVNVGKPAEFSSATLHAVRLVTNVRAAGQSAH